MARRGWLLAGALFFGSSLLSQPGRAQPTGASTQTSEQLLLAIEANNHPLSEGVEALQAADGSIYLPLGEIARLLGFGIAVDPAGSVAKGSGNASSISVDVAAKSITTAKGTRVLDAAAFQSTPGEIYLRTDVLEDLLGITVRTDFPGLQVTITSDGRLPFEDVIERQERRSQLQLTNGEQQDPGPVKEAPYRLLTPPAIDVLVEGGLTKGEYVGRNELRAAGDLLFGGYQLFLSSNGQFRHPNVRFTIDRRDLDGEFLGMTRIAAGDIFTPALPLGPRSNAGRGFSLTNEPYESLGIFEKLDLRGELPAGWEVELYVNELLTGFQKSSAGGQYGFLNVPLTYGQNALRLRFYGPNGEERDEVRRIAVGGGQVPKGHLIYNMGAVLDGRPLFDIGDEQSAFVGRVKGLNYAGNLRYGVTPWLTLTAGMGTYEPAGKELFVANIGARTALGPYSVQVDGAFDVSGGRAVSAAIAGPLFGGSIVARHTEYADGFIDEVSTGPGGDRPRRRSSDLRLNEMLHLGRLVVPIGLLLSVDVLSDGTPIYSGQVRTSVGWRNKRLSLGLGYRQDAGGVEQLTGSADIYLTDLEGWRLRGGLLADFEPESELRSLQLAAERSFGLSKLLSIGLIRNFGAYASTTVNGSLLLRARQFDFSVNANYEFKQNDFRIGGQLAFGFVHDPLRGRYAMTRPGATTTGSLALNAFQDVNGDGIRQPGEPGLRGISVDTGSYYSVQTNADGYALASGIGTGLVPVKVTAETSDDLVNIPADLRFRAASRPGRVILIEYPVAFVSEVMVRAVRRNSADNTGRQQLSGIRLVLISNKGQRFTQTTADDGGAYFTDLPPGEYRLEIDKDQAEELRARISSAIVISALPEGGAMLPVDVSIEIGGTAVIS